MSDYPTHVISREGGMLGEVRGHRKCMLEGCPSQCVCVKWPDGRMTWPCLRGCTGVSEDVVRIGQPREWKKK